MTIDECRIIQLPEVIHTAGNLTFIEGERHIPFAVKRVFYVYGVPGGAVRAGHALKTCSQFCIAVSGSFHILLHDGRREASFTLDQANKGLHIAPMVWRQIAKFSPGAVCLTLASEFYDEGDYIRDLSEYLARVNELKEG